MPIRNIGGLLENIVLVEAFRLLDEIVPAEGLIDFANAFAMPPLSDWVPNPNDIGFRQENIESLPDIPDIDDHSLYLRLLRRCVEHDPNTGPNGALLVTMAALLSGRSLRSWVNELSDDDERQHYPGAIGRLGNMAGIAAEITGNESGNSPAICDQEYPVSLANLRATLGAWDRERSCASRLGFLDPMKYTTGHRDFNQTSRDDYRQWLNILAAGTEGPIISVHFTGNRNYPSLNHELSNMLYVGFSQDYQSIQFRHDFYAMVVSIRCHGDEAVDLMRRLETNVSGVWSDWFNVVTGGPPSPLTSIVGRRLFD